MSEKKKAGKGGKAPLPDSGMGPAGGKPSKPDTKQAYDAGWKSGNGGKAPMPQGKGGSAPLPPKSKQGTGTPGAGKP